MGDFGRSIMTSQPVIDDILRVVPATIELATVGTLIGVTLGVPLGMLAAVNHGTWIDGVVRVISLIGYSIPVFWKGIMLLPSKLAISLKLPLVMRPQARPTRCRLDGRSAHSLVIDDDFKLRR